MRRRLRGRGMGRHVATAVLERGGGRGVAGGSWVHGGRGDVGWNHAGSVGVLASKLRGGMGRHAGMNAVWSIAVRGGGCSAMWLKCRLGGRCGKRCSRQRGEGRD